MNTKICRIMRKRIGKGMLPNGSIPMRLKRGNVFTDYLQLSVNPSSSLMRCRMRVKSSNLGGHSSIAQSFTIASNCASGCLITKLQSYGRIGCLPYSV